MAYQDRSALDHGGKDTAEKPPACSYVGPFPPRLLHRRSGLKVYKALPVLQTLDDGRTGNNV